MLQCCDSFCVHNLQKTTSVCTINWQLLFVLLQLVTFICTCTIDTFLYTTAIVNFCMYYCNYQHLFEILYKTCYELTLWLVELLSQLEMQNMTTECLNIINSLPTTDWQTERKTDIATCRAAITAWNAKYDNRMF